MAKSLSLSEEQNFGIASQLGQNWQPPYIHAQNTIPKLLVFHKFYPSIIIRFSKFSFAIILA